MNMGPPTGREWGGKEEKKMAQKRDRKPFLQNNSFQQKEVGKDGDGAAHPQSCVSPTAPRSGVAAQLPAVPPSSPLVGVGSVSAVAFVPPPHHSVLSLLFLGLGQSGWERRGGGRRWEGPGRGERMMLRGLSAPLLPGDRGVRLEDVSPLRHR